MNNNSVQNQGHNLIPVNQPTCFIKQVGCIYICNKMRHLARHCKEEYQDPRIPQNNNPQYPYRKNFTQQPQSRNNTNWVSRYFDTHHSIRITKIGNLKKSTNTNNPQQTCKDNYFKSTQQNNNWNNVQNTRTGTHESQKNNMSIRILGVDSISKYQENDFEYDATQPWSMKTQKITFVMTVTTTDINPIQTIRCQLLMKVTHMKLTSVIEKIHQ